MTERIAIYPGSFDPPTLGHLDLIQRAARMFDHLIVAVAVNDVKQALFSVEEREQMLREITATFPNVEVSSFEGLTVHFARERGAIALVRGLRVVSDFEFELSMALTNQKLDPGIDTVCLMPSEPYIFLSSRGVKEITRFGGDTAPFLPPEVSARLRKRLREKG
ncbi:MAG TPA: pantetheine-phosphate adenylyltransferase [Candidatus Hydrogenedentes bacterium]|nr:pantetheine-phosphate adenylyltransferase [Candidatus Hydrogenedentota bacterium]HPG67471.1 pantetheine-phosphate adenylyltransferase [Candidatus Hydrogenedentota bacterium]